MQNIIDHQNIKFAKHCLQRYYNYLDTLDEQYLREPAKVSDTHAVAGGVPLDMVAGEIDPEGWVKWKFLPSTLEAGAIFAFEQQFQVQFPPLFRAYLMAGFHLFEQIKDSYVSMPRIPSDDPFFDLRRNLENPFGSRLKQVGYVAFAWYSDSWGPICFDIDNPLPDGDFPVVWFDHEDNIFYGDEELIQREAISRRAQKLYQSFQEMLKELLYDEK